MKTTQAQDLGALLASSDHVGKACWKGRRYQPQNHHRLYLQIFAKLHQHKATRSRSGQACYCNESQLRVKKLAGSPECRWLAEAVKPFLEARVSMVMQSIVPSGQLGKL